MLLIESLWNVFSSKGRSYLYSQTGHIDVLKTSGKNVILKWSFVFSDLNSLKVSDVDDINKADASGVAVMNELEVRCLF